MCEMGLEFQEINANNRHSWQSGMALPKILTVPDPISSPSHVVGSSSLPVGDSNMPTFPS